MRVVPQWLFLFYIHCDNFVSSKRSIIFAHIVQTVITKITIMTQTVVIIVVLIIDIVSSFIFSALKGRFETRKNISGIVLMVLIGILYIALSVYLKSLGIMTLF